MWSLTSSLLGVMLMYGTNLSPTSERCRQCCGTPNPVCVPQYGNSSALLNMRVIPRLCSIPSCLLMFNSLSFPVFSCVFSSYFLSVCLSCSVLLSLLFPIFLFHLSVLSLPIHYFILLLQVLSVYVPSHFSSGCRFVLFISFLTFLNLIFSFLYVPLL